MTQYWEPGTQYGYGDVVQYNGHRYKIIQSHLSQSDWTPDITPALWGRLSDEDHAGECGNPEPPDKKPDHKTWFDFDDERKKQIEIGGGLVAGAALLGAGYFAFKEHKKSEEEKKAQTWALQNWLQDAQTRTEQYRHNGPRGPAEWILNQGKNIPHNAIVVGKEHDWTLYICRAFYDGGIQIGKASDVFKKGAVIGYDNEEIHLDTYEILIGDMRGLRWVDASGRLNVASLGASPVEGGHESDGTPLYIAEAPHKGAVHPGKASAKLDGAVIPYDNHEKTVHLLMITHPQISISHTKRKTPINTPFIMDTPFWHASTTRSSWDPLAQDLTLSGASLKY
ncbi:carbohydrate-binding module family 12 protein [Guyanagaster necrorhizus]|uniref:Carbohydrate-binding module family 12 protein n=1 Tax=Guyanagaster necrorhizus TaxID=856835 RepID=A0A9P7VUP1_9AGAR|nr:carbohydrate-binding module family 12 protein [Guyanagaster necrorhizus MCA 3950]KAG7446459.1 carbohydrate-binding module family 12 protein [Guyanagaster necrorhizus MCA 3950]